MRQQAARSQTEASEMTIEARRRTTTPIPTVPTNVATVPLWLRG
jgi:ABC-type enterochelin transport system substrate-binding protein